jgi:TRAP-type C4-dicarboxylate transport system substrate-binding protein
MKAFRTASFAAILAVCGGSASAGPVTDAVHFAPSPSDFTRGFLRFLEAVNERGKGVVRLEVRSGPEVVPGPQIGTAPEAGLVDMIQRPAGLYLERVPEGEGFAGTSFPPMEARAVP